MTEQGALSFGGLLRKLRAEARLTQEELAEAAGWPHKRDPSRRPLLLPRRSMR